MSDLGDRRESWACPKVGAGQTGLSSDCWALGGGGEGWAWGLNRGLPPQHPCLFWVGRGNGMVVKKLPSSAGDTGSDPWWGS